MNYNKLMFFIIVLGLGSTQLRAQNDDIKEMNKIIPIEIIDVKSIPLQNPIPSDVKYLKIANRHRDLINATVKSKIKCTSDLFIIVNNKAAC